MSLFDTFYLLKCKAAADFKVYLFWDTRLENNNNNDTDTDNDDDNDDDDDDDDDRLCKILLFSGGTTITWQGTVLKFYFFLMDVKEVT